MTTYNISFNADSIWIGDSKEEAEESFREFISEEFPEIEIQNITMTEV